MQKKKEEKKKRKMKIERQKWNHQHPKLNIVKVEISKDMKETWKYLLPNFLCQLKPQIPQILKIICRTKAYFKNKNKKARSQRSMQPMTCTARIKARHT